MIGLGVPPGANMPTHDTASNPAKPCSATVGTSGNCLSRVSPPIAIARTVAGLNMRQRDRGRNPQEMRLAPDHRRA